MVALINVVLMAPTPASAGGAIQVSGVGFPDLMNECEAGSQGADFAVLMTGDLEGCLYAFVDVENTQCINTGNGGSIYHERGTETFVGEYNSKSGTFGTTYLFTSQWSGPCEGGFPTGEEIAGRCQHPIVAGTGTDDFEGVTGRLDFKDVIVPGNPDAITFPYRGHLQGL
jgi:hypothetical protein